MLTIFQHITQQYKYEIMFLLYYVIIIRGKKLFYFIDVYLVNK